MNMNVSLLCAGRWRQSASTTCGGSGTSWTLLWLRTSNSLRRLKMLSSASSARLPTSAPGLSLSPRMMAHPLVTSTTGAILFPANVMCWAVLCSAVPCCAVPCHAVPGWGGPDCRPDMPGCAVLCRAVLCHAMPCCAALCCAFCLVVMRVLCSCCALWTYASQHESQPLSCCITQPIPSTVLTGCASH